MSEFGAGVVVCLVKFSEHLAGGATVFDERQIWEYANWLEMTDDEREAKKREAVVYPLGDASELVKKMRSIENVYEKNGGPIGAISRLIEMWMNGASDHFYDLDRSKAPESLIELADLTLEIGHGFGLGPQGRTSWTMEDVKRIRELWKKSCIAVDEMLGTKPEWGDW